MPRTSNPRLLKRLLLASRVANLIVLAISCLALLGWVLGVEPLKRVFPGMIEMNPMSGMNFIGLGIALWLIRETPPASTPSKFARLAPAFSIAFGVVVLCRYLFGWDTPVDQLLFRSTLGANRMAPNTALNFVLISCALLLLPADAARGAATAARRRHPAHLFTLATALIALLALVGYSYGVGRLYGVGAFIPMALHVAGSFLLLAVAVLAARPEAGFMARIVEEGAGGEMVRRMLFVTIVVPLLLGWVMLAGHGAGYYDAAFGFTMFVVVVIAFLSTLIWTNARALAREESKRDEAAAGLRAARDELDERVRERTASLARVVAEVRSGIAVLGSSATEIATSARQLAQNASATAGAVTETTTTAAEVRQTAETASERATHVAESAQAAARISQAGRDATGKVNDGMRRIRDQMESIAANMTRLSTQTLTIGEIIATVEDISEQSNLLAVNAAIEAAKAGEYGRGFGVVADAVKHLASQSREATRKVRTILSDIQKATSAAVMSTELGTRAVEAGAAQSSQAGEAIQTLADRVSDAASAATQIAASSREQFVAIDQVVDAMKHVEAATGENENGAKQLESAARDIDALGRRLKELVERHKT